MAVSRRNGERKLQRLLLRASPSAVLRLDLAGDLASELAQPPRDILAAASRPLPVRPVRLRVALLTLDVGVGVGVGDAKAGRSQLPRVTVERWCGQQRRWREDAANEAVVGARLLDREPRKRPGHLLLRATYPPRGRR